MEMMSRVEALVRKFYASANAVMGRLGRVCREMNVWKVIFERQLFPVSHAAMNAIYIVWIRVLSDVPRFGLATCCQKGPPHEVERIY